MTARNSYLLRKYGITEEQYNEMLRRGNGSCWVCHRPASQFRIRLSVDHDHHTGRIRGLLCNMCNRYVIGRHRAGLGGVELFANASQYLAGPYTGWTAPVKKKKRKRKVRR